MKKTKLKKEEGVIEVALSIVQLRATCFLFVCVS